MPGLVPLRWSHSQQGCQTQGPWGHLSDWGPRVSCWLHLVMRPRHQTRKGSFEIWDGECRDLTWPGASVGELQSDQVKLQDSYGHAPC